MDYDAQHLIVRQIYDETDEAMKKINNVCAKGCHYCCHQFISIIPVEELAITRYIKNEIHYQVRKQLCKRIIEWFEYFDQHTPKHFIVSTEHIQEFEKQCAKDKYPCPFLIDNACSIYPVRPIVCRTHAVTTPIQTCEENPLNNPCQQAIIIQATQSEKIMNLSDEKRYRPLMYALTDLFDIKLKIKPIQTIGLRGGR